MAQILVHGGQPVIILLIYSKERLHTCFNKQLSYRDMHVH